MLAASIRFRLLLDRMESFHGTTILSVRRSTPEGWQVAIGGDGQVTLGSIVVKGSARKVRKLYHGKVLAGFAGATADAFTLFERLEAKLETYPGNLTRITQRFDAGERYRIIMISRPCLDKIAHDNAICIARKALADHRVIIAVIVEQLVEQFAIFARAAQNLGGAAAVVRAGEQGR